MADFKGKFLVIVFFKNNDSKEFLKAFSDLADLFRGNKIEVETISKKIRYQIRRVVGQVFGAGPKCGRG